VSTPPGGLTALADEGPLDVAQLPVPPAPVPTTDGRAAVLVTGPARQPEPEGGRTPVGPRPPVPEEADPGGVSLHPAEDVPDLGGARDGGQVHPEGSAALLGIRPCPRRGVEVIGRQRC